MPKSTWDKLKENLIDFVKSCDDTPTDEQNRVYDILVGGLIGEGDRLQVKNKALRKTEPEWTRYFEESMRQILSLKNYVEELEKRELDLAFAKVKLVNQVDAIRTVVEENRSWLVLDLDGQEIIRLLDEVLS